MNQLRNLHDATLRQICLDWTTGQFSAELLVGAKQQEARIIGEGLDAFIFSRKFAWGRSVSVNECKIETHGGRSVLTIEMQSGDELVGTADSFSVHFHT